MLTRAVAIVVLALTLVLVPAGAAYADLYYVSGSEGALEATGTRLYGVAADSWVQFDPHQVYSLHLNSVYVWLDTNDYVEAGWAWYVGECPQAYVAYERKGFTTEQQRIWLGPVQPGSYVHLEISNPTRTEKGPVRWEVAVGDKRAAVFQDFGRGTLRVSSERQTYRDSGYGLFSGIRKLGADGPWQPWRDLRVQSGDQDYEGFLLGPDGFEVR